MSRVLTWVALALLVCGAASAGGCAEEEPYPLVIGDTTDGPDEVVLPGPVVVTSGESEWSPPEPDRNYKFGVTRAHDAQYCYDVQYAHYHRPGCWQVYHNDAWLAYALQACNNGVNQATDACVDEHATFHYWLTHRAQLYSPTPPYGPYWYGDQFRWECWGGWPVLTQPNDTDALWQAYLACEPNI